MTMYDDRRRIQKEYGWDKGAGILDEVHGPGVRGRVCSGFRALLRCGARPGIPVFQAHVNGQRMYPVSCTGCAPGPGLSRAEGAYIGSVVLLPNQHQTHPASPACIPPAGVRWVHPDGQEIAPRENDS